MVTHLFYLYLNHIKFIINTPQIQMSKMKTSISCWVFSVPLISHTAGVPPLLPHTHLNTDSIQTYHSGPFKRRVSIKRRSQLSAGGMDSPKTIAAGSKLSAEWGCTDHIIGKLCTSMNYTIYYVLIYMNQNICVYRLFVSMNQQCYQLKIIVYRIHPCTSLDNRVDFD